ncbi:16S rRNA (guanine(966)-N(2))-methyltransferase RsmD [Porticoccus hydrocarbonoclasticus]|uniref:16S rRNA (guanine(966)-N(2))-methyltransferase RsmD n=1 Tax=Porticoccus TaxID=1123967 RepID=UPI00068C591F|nr:16S rRNA (guanine(966)-N(2))-methyltransferase RsmD [Porticoccus hydrocarbonoclasticus]
MKNHPSTAIHAAKVARSQVRIIGGQWRGRKLQFNEVAGLRPTGDRIRETLFNWLTPWIDGARCLDLFAGSGALGIEALSRGAAEVTLIEKHPQAAENLRDNCARLKADDARIIQADTLVWLTNNSPDKPFDIVFLDPPFSSDLLQPCCELLQKPGLLATGSLIYLETDRYQPLPEISPTWELLREKTAGQVSYRLYRVS